MEKEEIKKLIDTLGLTVGSVFVPWSKSRNAKPDPKLNDYNLNFKVTVFVRGREVLTTDYMMGLAHCPSYKFNDHSMRQAETIKRECETGRTPFAKPILPDPVDVIYSLIMDSEVLDCSTFEDWASSYGYDTDSRSAEKIYRQCLETALKLKNGIGYQALEQLKEAFQDY